MKKICLFLLGFGLYLFSINGEFVWDDWSFFVENVYVDLGRIDKIFLECTTCGSGQVSNYYRPLTTLSYAIDKALWGDLVWGYHLTNAVLHGLVGVVLFALLTLLAKQSHKLQVTSHKLFEKIIFWICVMFLVHPLGVEAVSYINSRADSLYSLFLLLGLLVGWKWVSGDQISNFKNQNGTSKSKKNHLIDGKRGLVISWGFFLIAMLAKEMAVGGVGVLLLFVVLKAINSKSQIFSSKQIPNLKFQSLKFIRNQGCVKDVVLFLGWSSVALGYWVVRLRWLSFIEGGLYDASSEFAETLMGRTFSFGRVFWEYVRILLWPQPLYMQRSVEVLPILNWWFVSMVVVNLLVLGVGWWEWRKEKSIWTWFGWGWFWSMVLPVSGIVVPINGLLYEHWLYMAQVGVWVVGWRIVDGVWQVADSRWSLLQRNEKKLRRVLKVGMVVWIGVLICLNINQQKIWADEERLFLHTVKFVQKPEIYSNLARVYYRQGEFEKALENVERAIELGDRLPQPYIIWGKVSEEKGEYTKAQEAYERSVRVAEDFYPGYMRLAELSIWLEDWQKAEWATEKLLALDRKNWKYLMLRGEVAWKQGNQSLAREMFDWALEESNFSKETEDAIKKVMLE